MITLTVITLSDAYCSTDNCIIVIIVPIKCRSEDKQGVLLEVAYLICHNSRNSFKGVMLSLQAFFNRQKGFEDLVNLSLYLINGAKKNRGSQNNMFRSVIPLRAK